MPSFDIIFNCIYLAVLGYQMLYFLVQYTVLKRIELFYYSIFLLVLVLYYCIYVFVPVLHNQQREFQKQAFTSVEAVFLVAVNIFYLKFLQNYLDLHLGKSKLFQLIKYCVVINLFLMAVFIIMFVFNIKGQAILLTASIITMPLSFAVLILVWLKKGVYARVAAVGMSFAVVTELVCHLFIESKTDTYALYGGSVYTIVQVGVMIDVFVLGYGLSLRAAESDKKLVQTLIENQTIVETERSRLAKDLHDGLGGLLSGIKLTLNGVADKVPQKETALFNKALNQLDTAISEMRRVAHNMMPEALLKFGLGEAIQDLCDGINESNAVKMKYIQMGSLQALTQSAEIVLYRIMQELTNNALKHAEAKNIFIQITKHQKGFSITVEDDGKGFDYKIPVNGESAGLKNVRSRVEYLKGNLSIDSEKGKGTSVVIEMPANP